MEKRTLSNEWGSIPALNEKHTIALNQARLLTNQTNPQNFNALYIEVSSHNPIEKLVHDLERELTDDTILEWYYTYIILHRFIIGSELEIKEIESSWKVGDSDIPVSKGGICEVNQRYQERWVKNMTKFEFVSFYPNQIIESTKNLECNFSGFHEVYSSVTDLRRQFKKMELRKECETSNAGLRLKHFLNVTYGITGGYKPPIKFYTHETVDVNLSHVVVARTRFMIQYLQNEFKNHVVYTGTDMIFFRHYNEISQRVESTISKDRRFNHHSFETTGIFEGIFLGRKKYLIVDDNGNITRKGIREV